MKKVGVAILGLGVVGGGTYKILTENKNKFLAEQGIDVTVESVLEINKQKAYDLGIDDSIICKNIAEVISNPAVDIIVEVIGGVSIAREFVLTALKSGKTVVSSNKELICKYWHELEATAKRNNAGLYFEASCVGGVPIIRTLIDGLQANTITNLTGIINGTTNYILTKMTNEGVSYEDALKEAQKLGYAEANPQADVEGFDASYKLSILSSLAFHKKVPLDKIYREGISNIHIEDITFGKQLGYSLKLLAIGKNSPKGIEVRVHPTFIKNDHPLASVNDSFNAVYMTGDSVGDVMLYGRGAGALPTGSAIVSDVIYAATHINRYSTFKNTETADKNTNFINDFESAYYIRFTAVDKAGVLSKVSGLFAKCGISITELFQKGQAKDGKVPVVIITHKTREFSVRNAVEKINALEDIASVDTVIRVE